MLEMWGGAEEGKMGRRILISWGFWPQRDVVRAGGGRKGKHGQKTGWCYWHTVFIPRFMVGPLN